MKQTLISKDLDFQKSRYRLKGRLTHKKSWAILQNFNYQLTKTPILPNCQVPNIFFFRLTVNLIIQQLKFYKIAQLCLSVSSSRERKYERIERFFFTKSQPMISWYRQPLNPDLPAWNSLIRPPRNRLEFKVVSVSVAFIVSP